MTDNELTYQIRGAIFDVYNELGPGLLESVYEEALVFDLQERGLKVYFQDTSKQFQPLFTTKQSSQDCHQYKKNNLCYLWYLCEE